MPKRIKLKSKLPSKLGLDLVPDLSPIFLMSGLKYRKVIVKTLKNFKVIVLE